MAEQRAESEVPWTAFESRLNAYVRRRVEPAAVEDVVGDILLRLVQHRAALEAARNPIAWTLRLAANAIADHHRRRDVERRALSRAEGEAALESLEEADQGAAAEISRCILPLIEGLPAPYRDALLLTEIEGLTQVEAAGRLGLSVSGMKSRVQRGRAKLKQALLRCCAVRVDRRGGVVDYKPHGDGGEGCLRC